ncbi:hypothetical protein BJ741DRAFT_712775 [Chytriomyces cf. hyalinus JEL632]|nr:hypothetical protein BJ741DRAFT_712775 [Chytriomyces cf. hyalinus JEL632]
MSTSMIDSAFVNSPDTHTHAIKELWEEYSRFNSLNRHLQPATTTTTTTITPMQHFTATSTLKDRHAANRHTQVVIPKRSASLANTEILMPLSTSTPSAKRTFSLPNNRLRSSMYPHQTPPPSLMPVNPDERNSTKRFKTGLTIVIPPVQNYYLSRLQIQHDTAAGVPRRGYKPSTLSMTPIASIVDHFNKKSDDDCDSIISMYAAMHVQNRE